MIDIVTVEVIKGALIYAAEEMGISLRNSSYSPNIKERMDHSCAIFDFNARLIAQAEHIPAHLGSLPYGVKKGIEVYEGELEDGDILLYNDPYVSGTHLPDITLVAPIYFNNKLIGYVANKAHHSDVGGKVPGSMPSDVNELFQEGIIIPPIKFVKKGVVDKEILNLILSNVREPYIRIGDLRAQVAANMLGVRRVKEICSKYGIEKFFEAIDKIIEYSERKLRIEINKMPKGVFEAEDFMEDIGSKDEIAKIKVKITVKEDEIIFDYTGTSKQVDGPINAAYGVAVAGIYYTMLCITNPEIPMNDGFFKPILINIPEGTILNPKKPAPVSGGNTETSQRNVDVLLKAFAQIVPNKVCAACTGSMNNVAFGGVDENGRTWAFYETIAGGYGGRFGIDGVDAIHTHMTNTMNTPIEAIERNYPILFLKYGVRDGSCGAGKYRGGCGVERSWKLLAPTATVSIVSERHKIPPWGLFGGESGKTGEAFIIKTNGEIIKLKSKQTIRMDYGDVFIIKTAGGGGYGKPFDREPELVIKDVENGYITLNQALEEYGVVIKNGKIDYEETRRLRG
ncbi:MAG: hydantoinase B/oxoprolinase family protein [Nitrososphaerales archaeon]